MTDAAAPELSLVVPCYDEEAVVGRTVEELFEAFRATGRRLQVVAVDNGSRDRTGAILEELAGRHPGLDVVRVEVNRGYGNGILAGLPRTSAPFVGILCADGQVAARDVASLFESARVAPGPAVHKVRRRFRPDGLQRKILSVVYNLGMTVLYPGIGSIDVNGNPKILPRDVLERMTLASRDWFLDAEILIRARDLGLPVSEIDVVGRPRGGGVSRVRLATCLEFARNLFAWRILGRRRDPARRGDGGG